MFEEPFQTSSLIATTATRRKVSAFIVTSLTTFLLLCLAWPLAVNEYRSVASIEIAKSAILQDKDQIKPLLSFAVREEMKDGRLESALQDTEARTELRALNLAYRDYEKISNQLQVGVNETGDRFQLRIAIDGRGGQDERELLNVLTDRVAYRMSTGRLTGESQPTINLLDQIAPAEGVEAEENKLAQAEWILSQIDGDLQKLTDTLETYFPSDELALNPPIEDRRFQFASNRKIVRPELDDSTIVDMKQTIASIDTASLRTLLDQIRTQGVVANSNGLNVTGVQSSQSHPLEGMPDFGSCLLLMSLAGLFGSIVAWHFDPFEGRGFSDPYALSQRLKLPVLASLDSETPTLETEHYWANTITKLSSLILLGLTVVVVGFVMVNPEVREAFFQNPFHGMARIVGIFKGN